MAVKSFSTSTVKNENKKYNSLGARFTSAPYTTEYVVVAGGGGHPGSSGKNSSEGSGGGGAGGYRSSVQGELSGTDYPAEDPLLLNPGTYVVTIGAGSTGTGGSSSFASITSSGGGSGRARNSGGSAGGSGGGGVSSSANGTNSGYNGIDGEGTHGWRGASSVGGTGGGAGGASLGGATSTSRTTAGSPGLTTYILGVNNPRYVAVGGQGTNGGGSNGAANTGNGATGGKFNNGKGTTKSYGSRSGGSGIVFFKVPYSANVTISGSYSGPYYLTASNVPTAAGAARPDSSYLYKSYVMTSSGAVTVS